VRRAPGGIAALSAAGVRARFRRQVAGELVELCAMDEAGLNRAAVASEPGGWVETISRQAEDSGGDNRRKLADGQVIHAG